MPTPSPIWPAQLHHLQVTTPGLRAMTDFYHRAFSYRPRPLPDGRVHLAAGGRCLLLAPGAAKGLAFSAFTVQSGEQLAALRGHLREVGLPLEPSPTPLLREGAFAVRDPDGRALVFGLALDAGDATEPAPDGKALRGRLQHVVVTTLDLAAVHRFYEQQLGFVLSDRVLQEDDRPTTYFYRSDPEHHSFAAFLSDSVRLDHHALDAPDWNAIRDWSDAFSAQGIPIVWGPGRHGPGNNLFCMVADPDGTMIEISAELERMPREMAARDWPHSEHTLNLWGPGLMRI